MLTLVVVMPVFNEMEAIETVVTEWLAELRSSGESFKLMVFDDGSTDETPARLAKLIEGAPNELKVVTRTNNIGHGRTYLQGYEIALSSCDAQWILQVDSDGQCDPRYFCQFWRLRQKGVCVQAFRQTRGDGLSRVFISRTMTLVVFLMTGRFIRDVNTPYRLMDRDTLKAACEKIPKSIDLAHAALSYIYDRDYRIEWIPIHFNKRLQSKPPVTPINSIPIALNFIRQFNQSLL